MRWINKITDKRAAYDLIERERPHKTLDELADTLKVSRQRVWQMCKELGLNVKHSKWRNHGMAAD